MSNVNRRLSGRVHRVFAALVLLLAGLTASYAADRGIASAHAAAEDPPATLERLPLPGEELDVELVTIGPGQTYWQRFGHNAILIRDREAGSATLYNFGMFDFYAKNFFLEFARGRMNYLLAAGPVRPDLESYLADGRSIDLQWLDLEPAAKLALRDSLQENARPENATYRYDYFRDNCSTRVRDVLDRATGGALKRATDRRSRGYTWRMHAQRLTEADLPLYLGIHAALGPATDAPISFWDEMFIPMVLKEELAKIEIEGADGSRRPLVLSAERLSEANFPQPAEAPRSWFWRFFGVGLLLAGLLLWLGSSTTTGKRLKGFGALSGLLWMLSGVGGLVLAFLAFASEHQAAWHNENLALFNPLALLLLPVAWSAIRGRRLSSIVWPSLAAAILLSGFIVWLAKVMPGFRQDNMDWVGLWLPIHAALFWSILQGRNRMRLGGAPDS